MTDHQIHRTAQLWAQGNDTHRIAERLSVSEAAVYDNLPLIRHRARRIAA